MTPAKSEVNAQDTSWYCAERDRVVGPFTWPQLRTRAADGQLSPDDFVCPLGEENWRRAVSLDGLFAGRDETARSDTPSSSPAPKKSGMPHIPGYEILGELGRGGVGVVYKARQVNLNRLVALKVLHAAEEATSEDLARLTTEARALAKLRHPGIVQIFDVGTHAGLTYLSLELIEGGNLRALQGGKPLPPIEAASLLAEIARAVHVAHEHGIVHRDLKPANVLVAGRDRTVADLRHTLKITDFGLAKDLGRASQQTNPGTVMGTPCYMAPEQAEARSGDLSARTDVYALGVILYELLRGEPPWVGPPHVVLFNVLERQPPPLPAGIAPELERICLKCMAKKPAERYASARELADVLEKWVAAQAPQPQPVAAAPGGSRLTPWLVAGQVLTLAALALLAWWTFSPPRAEESHAEENNSLRQALADERSERVASQRRLERVLQEQSATRLTRAFQLARAGSLDSARAELNAVPGEGAWEKKFVEAVASDAFALPDQPVKITAVALSADGGLIAVGLRDGTLKVYRGDTATEWQTLPGSTGELASLAFSPEGDTLISASKDGSVVVWDLKSGESHRPEARAMTGTGDLVTANTRLLAWVWRTSNRDNTAFFVWDRAARSVRRCGQHAGGEVTALAIHPAGSILTFATTKSGSEYRIAGRSALQTNSAERLWDGENHTKPISSIGFSPDGKWLVSGSADKTLKIWDVTGRECKHTLTGHAADVLRAQFVGNDQIVSLDASGVVKRWDVATLKEVRSSQRKITGVPWGLALSGDGTRVALTTGDYKCAVWPTRPAAMETLCAEKLTVRWVVVLHNDKEVALAANDHDYTILEPLNGKIRKRYANPDISATDVRAMSPDGKQFVAYERSSMRLKVWSVENDKPADLDPALKDVRALAWDRQGQRLAAAGPKTLWLVDMAKRETVQTIPNEDGKVEHLLWSDDGTLLFAACGLTVQVWDTMNGKVARSVTFGSPVQALALYGQERLVVGCIDGNISICYPQSGKIERTLAAHKGRVGAVTFLDDGRRVVSGGEDGWLRWWDTATGAQVFAVDGALAVQALGVSRDGKHLFVGAGRWLRRYSIGP